VIRTIGFFVNFKEVKFELKIL